MSVGDRVDGWEVASIDEASARVDVRQEEQKLELTLNQTTSQPHRTLHFQAADLDQVLDLYQRISGRTVLRSPGLSSGKVDLQSGPGLSRAEAVAALEGEFVKQGLFMKNQRDKFVVVVSQKFTNHLELLPECPQDDGPVVFPAGQLKLHQADLFATLAILQELYERTLLRSVDLPLPGVTIRSQTSLSRAEAAWALEVLLRLGGVETIAEGEVFRFVLPRTGGPRPVREMLPGEPTRVVTYEHPMLRNVPRFDPAAYAAKARVAIEPSPLKINDEPVENLMPWYAALVGRLPAAIDGNVPRVRLYVKSHRPLSAGETIYALEALARINHLQFEFSGDAEVRLVNANLPANRPPVR